ncbi:hypothetical protein MMC30_007092 [Trapelia coarctata]|nr:hypothetical protein [Trapelia coarctata]
MEEIIQFNKDHREQELLPAYPGQQQLEMSSHSTLTSSQYEEIVKFVRLMAKTNGFDRIFVDNEVDLLMSSLDGRIVTIAAAAGYPACVIPLGYADNLNGRAYGVTIVAMAGREDQILEAMSAWEKTMPGRRPPPILKDWETTRAASTKSGLLKVLETHEHAGHHVDEVKDHRSPYFEWDLAYLDQKLQSLHARLKAVLTISDGTKESQASEAAVHFYELLAIIATALTTSASSPSMDAIKGSIPPYLVAEDDDPEALLQLIFIMMGFLTMLYDPDLDPAPNTVSIAKPLTLTGSPLSTDSITNYEYPLEDASHLQVHQLLNSFGRLIPGSLEWAREVSAGHQPDIFTEQLVLSYLSFHNAV